MDWVKAYLSIWTELQAYIKEYHTTGLTWSKTVSAGSTGSLGMSLARSPWQERSWCELLSSSLLFQGPVATAGAKAAPAPPAGAAPPPPGPPPPPAPVSSSTDDSASRSALFAQINRGEGITSGTSGPQGGRELLCCCSCCCCSLFSCPPSKHLIKMDIKPSLGLAAGGSTFPGTK